MLSRLLKLLLFLLLLLGCWARTQNYPNSFMLCLCLSRSCAAYVYLCIHAFVCWFTNWPSAAKCTCRYMELNWILLLTYSGTNFLVTILTLKIIYSPISSYLFAMCFPLWFVRGRIFMVFCGISVTGLKRKMCLLINNIDLLLLLLLYYFYHPFSRYLQLHT